MNPEIPSAESEVENPQVINLNGVSVEHVGAELVRASQSQINHVEADEVAIRGGMVIHVSAGRVSAHEAGLVAIQANDIVINQGAAGLALSETVNLAGRAGVVLTDTANLHHSGATLLVATHVGADRVQTGILIARRVEGNVETYMNTRQVVAAGVLSGLVAGLILLAGRLLFGRKK